MTDDARRQRDERLADARAAVKFRADPKRQMPDPHGDGDIRYLLTRTPKADELERLVEQQSSVNPAGAAWGSRKGDRACREMTEGNPWVQIVMRKALRSTCRWLAKNQSPYSNANRVEFRQAGGSVAEVAFTASYKSAFLEHRRQLAEMAPGDDVAIFTDARRLYSSISPMLIYNRMLQCGASAADARTVSICLERMQADTGIPGLPIGDETSGWLAELAMDVVHRALEAVPQLEFRIWSDDVYLGNGSPVIAEQGLAAYQTALQKLGTFVAPEKTVKSWELGVTPLELVRRHWPSSGDILFGELEGDPRLQALRLLNLLRFGHPSLHLVKSLLTLTAEKRGVPVNLAQEIVDALLRDPEAWEQCCPQGFAFLRHRATPDQRANAVRVALEMGFEGVAGCEQRVALFRLIEGPASLPLLQRGAIARDLLAYARRADAVPERQWARAAAYRIDPLRVATATIDSGEFGSLHPFEQKTAIAFADPRRHHWWLEQQQKGRWPTAAQARGAGQLSVKARTNRRT